MTDAERPLASLVEAAQAGRACVLANLEAVAPPKPGVRDRLLAGDADAIAGYRDALVPRWFPK